MVRQYRRGEARHAQIPKTEVAGIALGSWISTFIAPIALVLLVWRTIVEDRLLQRDLPGYADYATRVRYRLVPGVW
jgi:protein-S-isoprenylcysteine O-methyltransferase Ste14